MGAAAIIGGIGVATQLVGAGMSFAQAKKQKELKSKADAAAAKAMVDAKNKLVTNFSEQQVIRKEPFELAAQANAAVQSQNIDAMRNAGQRTLIGGVGRTVAAGDRANQQMRDVYTGKLEEYEKRVADDSRDISDYLAGIDLRTASGAQKAAAQAELMRQRNLMQGISALGGAAATGLDAAGLYTGGGLGTNTPDTTDVSNTEIQYEVFNSGFDPNLFNQGKYSTTSPSGQPNNNLSKGSDANNSGLSVEDEIRYIERGIKNNNSFYPPKNR
jgi:hypothetical protein